jgi:hypothetical protein
VIVIGAQKCGTSALHYYLDLHPEVAMSRPKELNFFLDHSAPDRRDTLLAPGERHLVAPGERNFSRGLDWYAERFPRGARVRGESSPGYTAPWFPEVAERMASVVPDAKLVFIVRDPIERALSHYLHFRADGRERRPADEALAHLDGPYVVRSRYHAALEPYLRHFPRSSVLVISGEDLLRRRRETMREVYAFVGVDDSFWSPKHERERNRTERAGAVQWTARRLASTRLGRLAYRLPEDAKWAVERLAPARRSAARPVLGDAVSERLRSHLRGDAARLRELTGKAFADWSV